MNIRKNFEAVFIAAATLGLVASYATAKVPTVEVAQAAPVIKVVQAPKMHIVVVKGQRLSAAEKARLG